MAGKPASKRISKRRSVRMLDINGTPRILCAALCVRQTRAVVRAARSIFKARRTRKYRTCWRKSLGVYHLNDGRFKGGYSEYRPTAPPLPQIRMTRPNKMPTKDQNKPKREKRVNRNPNRCFPRIEPGLETAASVIEMRLRYVARIGHPPV